MSQSLSTAKIYVKVKVYGCKPRSAPDFEGFGLGNLGMSNLELLPRNTHWFTVCCLLLLEKGGNYNGTPGHRSKEILKKKKKKKTKKKLFLYNHNYWTQPRLRAFLCPHAACLDSVEPFDTFHPKLPPGGGGPSGEMSTVGVCLLTCCNKLLGLSQSRNGHGSEVQKANS